MSATGPTVISGQNQPSTPVTSSTVAALNSYLNASVPSVSVTSSDNSMAAAAAAAQFYQQQTSGANNNSGNIPSMAFEPSSIAAAVAAHAQSDSSVAVQAAAAAAAAASAPRYPWMSITGN